MTDAALYLETSCLLKLLFYEPDSPRVHELVAAESDVVVTSLVELEAEQQILARYLAGRLSRSRRITVLARMRELLAQAPFERLSPPVSFLDAALRQARGSRVYCRTLDRLHLGAMEALGLRRLLTNDDQQAAAARALGFEVILPR